MLSLLSRILVRLLCRQNIRRAPGCNPIRQSHPGLTLGMKTSHCRILPKQTLLVLLRELGGRGHLVHALATPYLLIDNSQG